MQAAKHDYCRCYKKLNLEKNHYIILFGEKAVEEGIVDAVRKYGNINVVEEDIGVVSTKICRICYSQVKSIMEKIEKFSDICKASFVEKDSLDENLEMKRSVGGAEPISGCRFPFGFASSKTLKTSTRWINVAHESKTFTFSVTTHPAKAKPFRKYFPPKHGGNLFYFKYKLNYIVECGTFFPVVIFLFIVPFHAKLQLVSTIS